MDVGTVRSILLCVIQFLIRNLKFKIKSEYLELLALEAMKLLKSTQEILTKDKNSEDVLQLKITEVVLVHSNIINNQYQYDSRVFFTSVPVKSFEQLRKISPTNHIYSESFHSQFAYFEVSFTDQNFIHRDRRQKNVNLIINDKGIS